MSCFRPGLSNHLRFVMVLVVGLFAFGRLLVIPVRTSPRQTPVYKLYGLDFSPYVDGQDPNFGVQITLVQLQARLQIVAPYTRWVRSFSSTHGLENLPAVARTFGLKVAAGAWIGQDLTANALEISNVIAAAQAGNIDLIVVGSETLLRNDISASQLIAYMQQVRQAVPAGIPVTTADTFDRLLAHPEVIAASDVVMPNIYPYWQGVALANALCTTASAYQQVVAAAGGKPVVISEIGWPSGGSTVGAAVPSLENASAYFAQFLTWARQNDVPYFYFEALDETWKAAYEGSQGATWGIFDKNGVLKPGMQAGFDGQTVSVGCNGVPGAGAGSTHDDFTGDGKPDLIWQQPGTGAVLLWQMDGSNYVASTILFSGTTSWRLVATGDFTGDGKPDLLWQDPYSNAVLLWIMNGTSYVGETFLCSGTTSWRVVAAADFTGDGKADLIWQDPYTNAVLVWAMNGTSYVSESFLFLGTTSWRVVGAADFTGDGKTDLVWQDPYSNSVLLWVMNGTSYVSETFLLSGSTSWRVVAIGDFTGDGKNDLIWQEPYNNAVLLWRMNGPTYISETSLSSGGTYWQVKGPR